MPAVATPWWLPEGADPAHIMMAGDAVSGWQFSGSSWQSTFSPFQSEHRGRPVDIHDPVIIFDRTLSNLELASIYLAFEARQMATIEALNPAHIRYRGDIDDRGICHCAMCEKQTPRKMLLHHIQETWT